MKKYKIEKNNHYPKGIHFGITFSRKISFKAKFDESCLYHFGDVDDYDINKLFGFSTTWHHHRQSARVGWRCLDGNKIQLLTYSYNSGIRTIGESDILGIVKPNEIFYCDIIDKEHEYVYVFRKANEKKELIRRDPKFPDWFLFHYLLFPYFGGNKTAPHDMQIYVNKK